MSLTVTPLSLLKGELRHWEIQFAFYDAWLSKKHLPLVSKKHAQSERKQAKRKVKEYKTAIAKLQRK